MSSKCFIIIGRWQFALPGAEQPCPIRLSVGSITYFQVPAQATERHPLNVDPRRETHRHDVCHAGSSLGIERGDHPFAHVFE